jgi:hypothetical protein
MHAYAMDRQPRITRDAAHHGMSKLYADEEAYGGDFSGWGYEMTMKVRATSPDDCWWAVSSLRNLARYTYPSKRWFEPYQFISGQGRPLRADGGTILTSYVTAPDTEVAGIDTVHGREPALGHEPGAHQQLHLNRPHADVNGRRHDRMSRSR